MAMSKKIVAMRARLAVGEGGPLVEVEAEEVEGEAKVAVVGVVAVGVVAAVLILVFLVLLTDVEEGDEEKKKLVEEGDLSFGDINCEVRRHHLSLLPRASSPSSESSSESARVVVGVRRPPGEEAEEWLLW